MNDFESGTKLNFPKQLQKAIVRRKTIGNKKIDKGINGCVNFLNLICSILRLPSRFIYINESTTYL